MKQILFFFSLCALSLLAVAQPGRIPVMTRGMKVFSELEQSLADAGHKADKAALGTLLAPEFEQRSAAHPGEPTPRAEWIANIAQQPPAGTALGGMAVHDYGDVAVVSFLLGGEALANGASASWFVIDTWQKSGSDWRLAVRYIAPRGKAAPTAPTAPGDQGGDAVIQKKF